jgi:outer membrane lipoprotein LolB
LSVQQSGTKSQAFSATFELAGDANLGQLALYSPLGSTIAHIRWTPQGAVLSGQGTPRTFATLGSLTQELTGTELPIDGVFAWLAGSEALVNGWKVDAADLDAGKLFAHRTDATTRTTLKILLDR